MRDVSQVAEVVLKLMGIYPIIDRLMDAATETVDGEYGALDDEDDELDDGVCYSSYQLVSNGVLCELLETELDSKSRNFFMKVAGGNLKMDIERSVWGEITLSMNLGVPLSPNAEVVDKTFPLEIEIKRSASNFVIVGSMLEDKAEAHAKYLSYYALLS
jgi:hypothetical protein